MTCRTAALFCVVSMIFGMAGCGKETEKEHVELTVWGPAGDNQKMLEEMAEEFKEAHADEVDLDVIIEVADESSLAENVVTSPTRAADIFAFPDDQFPRLMDANVLLPLTWKADEVIEANGGKDRTAVQCAMSKGQLYAYPMTASNGYFMYYNADYFTESDVKTLDGMLSVAEKNGKKISMDWSSGWYVYSFFRGAGFELMANEQETANVCDWNGVNDKYRGVDVAEAMLHISSSGGFVSCDDIELRKGIADGSIIAAVNGQWSASFVEEQWGENYRAVKLPTYTMNGKQLQMGSFMGYKLIGVNANTEYPEWAMKFAEWITNDRNQLKRFELTGECPSNVEAAKNEEVMKSQAVKALAEQAPYASQQRVVENFWTPATVFGTIMASGNLDGRDLQELLDSLVAEATKPVSPNRDQK